MRGHHRHIFNEEEDLNHREDYTLQDAVSSFVVLDGTWRLYKDANYLIPYEPIFGPGIYRWVEDHGVKNDEVSSLRTVPPPP